MHRGWQVALLPDQTAPSPVAHRPYAHALVMQDRVGGRGPVDVGDEKVLAASGP